MRSVDTDLSSRFAVNDAVAAQDSRTQSSHRLAATTTLPHSPTSWRTGAPTSPLGVHKAPLKQMSTREIGARIESTLPPLATRALHRNTCRLSCEPSPHFRSVDLRCRLDREVPRRQDRRARHSFDPSSIDTKCTLGVTYRREDRLSTQKCTDGALI
jgi:hypothetical protein